MLRRVLVVEDLISTGMSSLQATGIQLTTKLQAGAYSPSVYVAMDLGDGCSREVGIYKRPGQIKTVIANLL